MFKSFKSVKEVIDHHHFFHDHYLSTNCIPAAVMNSGRTNKNKTKSELWGLPWRSRG